MIELTMQVSDFDYSETLEAFLPEILNLLQENESINPLIRKAVTASPDAAKAIAKTALSAMSQSQKEALTVKFLNKNMENLCSSLNEVAAKYGVILTLENGKAIAR